MPDQHDTSSPIETSVILPVFNEEQALREVICELRSALGSSPEIIVVDDSSTDRSYGIAANENVTIVRHTETRGYGAAVKTGILQANGAVIVVLDADGTYVPAEIPGLLSFLPAYDQVNGLRTSEQGSYRILRSPAKWFIRKLAEWISGKSIPDLNTGMKVFKRELALRYLWVVPDGFSCSTSLTLAFLCNGHSVRYIPVTYRRRQGRSKFRPLRDGVNYCFTIIRMMTYFHPLRVFLPIAGGIALVALAKGTYDLFTYPTGLHDSDIILATASLIVFVIGLLADLIVAQQRRLP